MGEKSEKGCMTTALILVVVVSTILAGAWYTKKQYKSKQETIEKALSELPEFDEVAAGQEIAEKMGVDYPVPEPLKTPEEIDSQAKKESDILTKEKFTLKNFARKQALILKKYRPAKNGDKVSFILNTTGENVTGTLKGVYKDHKGRFVKVGIHEYRLPDIMDDYYYLFDSGVANQKSESLLKELRTTFKEGKSTFRLKTRTALAEKLYKQSGYTKDGGKWISNVDAFKAALEAKRAAHSKMLESEKKKIYEQNKLFGLIDVNLLPMESNK